MLVKLYAVALAFLFGVGVIFYVIQYLAVGGRLLAAMRGALKISALLFPLSLVVFLYATNAVWPNRIVWLLYGIFSTACLISVLSSRKNRKNLKNFKEKLAQWPIVGSIVLLFFLVLVIPPYVILWLYVLRS